MMVDVDQAGALHDFNNAVQAAAASLRHLQRCAGTGDAEALAAMIAAIADQVTRLGALGGSLARSTTRAASAALPRLALGSFVRSMAHQIPALLDGHIRLEVLVDTDTTFVACDPARLESAIRNLVLNARDAMPDGGVLSLRGQFVAPGRNLNLDGADGFPGPCAAITVADTGRGMDADTLRRCFDPFVTTKAAQGGTGLGLFQLRSFVLEMGGKVQMRSRSGYGTEATILLPCAG